MRAQALGALLFICSLAHAQAKPVWDTYPNLVCRYDVGQICSDGMTVCRQQNGAAVLTFDFAKNQVRSFAANRPFPIDGKYHYELLSGDVNTVFAEGHMYSFGHATSERSGPVTIMGIAQSTTAGATRALNVQMTCHPG